MPMFCSQYDILEYVLELSVQILNLLAFGVFVSPI